MSAWDGLDDDVKDAALSALRGHADLLETKVRGIQRRLDEARSLAACLASDLAVHRAEADRARLAYTTLAQSEPE